MTRFEATFPRRRLRKANKRMAREAEKSAIAEILSKSLRRSPSRLLGPRQYACELLGHPEFKDVIQATYRDLGGCLSRCPGNLGSWDISLSDLAVEFDEEQHFNRYRLLTLQCELYARLLAFPLGAYREFCRNQERSCLSKACHGKYWTSESSERQFGHSDARGTFGSRGSARWKQRAFYDMLKDLSSLVSNVPVVRLSIWDSLSALSQPVTVRDALRIRTNATDRAIVELVRQRASPIS